MAGHVQLLVAHLKLLLTPSCCSNKGPFCIMIPFDTLNWIALLEFSSSYFHANTFHPHGPGSKVSGNDLPFLLTSSLSGRKLCMCVCVWEIKGKAYTRSNVSLGKSAWLLYALEKGRNTTFSGAGSLCLCAPPFIKVRWKAIL